MNEEDIKILSDNEKPDISKREILELFLKNVR